MIMAIVMPVAYVVAASAIAYFAARVGRHLKRLSKRSTSIDTGTIDVDAFNEGRLAYKERHGLEPNPYPPATTGHASWASGYENSRVLEMQRRLR